MADIDALGRAVSETGGSNEQAIAMKGKLIRYIITHIRKSDKELGDFLGRQ